MSGNEVAVRRTKSCGLRRVACGALVLFTLVVAPSFTMAQPPTAPKPKPKPEELKAYTLPYFFAIVGVLAVLSPLCMPVKRKWDVPNRNDE